MIDDRHIDWRAFFCAMKNIVELETHDDNDTLTVIEVRAGEYDGGRITLAKFLDVLDGARK